MKIVERVLERKIRKLVNVDTMLFGLVPARGTTVKLFFCKNARQIQR